MRIARHLVSNAEWLAFIDAGGYTTPSLWLSDGWAAACRRKAGRRPAIGGRRTAPGIDDARRAAADRPGGARHACQLLRGRRLRPLCRQASAERGRVGSCRSRRRDRRRLSASLGNGRAAPICLIPATAPPQGALGEYNGKFMVSQMVLRGSSLATPEGHERVSYRNFFYPPARWQFSGLRLAEFNVEESMMVALARSRRISPQDAGTARLRGRRARWLERDAEAGAAEIFLRRRRLAVVRAHHRTAGILPDPLRDADPARPRRARSRKLIPAGAALVEFGSGSSKKARILLRAAPPLAAYVPVDICGEMIEQEAAELRPDFPGLKVLPVTADITQVVRACRAGAGGAGTRRLFSRLHHRQFRAARGGGLPAQCRDAFWARRDADHRRRSDQAGRGAQRRL